MPDYTLVYWPIPFRGHFARFVLAHAGATWDETGYDEVIAQKSLPVAEQPYPFMAPPLLVDHADGRRLSQLPAILMFLGRRHGLTGEPDRALRLICDAMDVLFEITRYHGAQMWDRGNWAAFVGGRLPRWMQMHEGLLRDAGTPFFDGEEPMLADLAMTALWHTMADRLPGMRPLLHAHAPRLETMVDAVAASDRVAAVLADWQERVPRYCGGEIEESILDMLGAGGAS